MNELVTRPLGPLGFRSRHAAFKWYRLQGELVWHEYIVGSPECQFGGSWTMNPFIHIYIYTYIYIYREGPSCKIAVPAFAACSIAPGEYSLKLLEHINWRMHVQLISGVQKKTANPQTCAGSIRTGWWYTYPSEKYEVVSWDDEIPNLWKVIIHSCFKSTNQCRFNKDTLW